MSNHILKSSLPIYMAMLMGQMGYRVRFVGEEACIDYKSKEVLLPAGDFSDVEYRRLVIGVGVHEAGHGKFTVIGERPKEPTSKQLSKEPSLAAEFELTRWLYNALEDVRQEREVIADVPGTKYALDDVIGCARNRGWFDVPAVEEGPLAMLRAYCLFQARSQHRGQDLLNELAEVKRRMVEMVPADLVDALKVKMAEIVTPGASTKDSTRIAQEMVQAIKSAMQDLLDQQQQQQQQSAAGQTGQPQSQTDQSDTGGADGTQGQDQSDSSGNGQGQAGTDQANSGGTAAPSSAGGDQSNQQGQSGNGQAAGDGSPSASSGQQGSGSSNGAGGKGAGAGMDPAALGEAVKNLGEILANQLRGGPDRASDLGDVLKDAVAEAMADPKHRGFGDLDLSMDRTDDEAPAKQQDVTGLRQRISRSTRNLAANLQTLLEAQTFDVVTHDDFGVDVDVAKVARLFEGRRDIFREEEEAPDVDTAMMFLLDRSGSTSKIIQTVVDATASASLAVERVPDCSVGVACFPAYNAGRPVTVMSPLGGSPSKNLSRLQTASGGSTPMAEALWWAAMRLNETSHVRKLVCVVTDGRPNNERTVNYVSSLLKEAGIEVVGIGIGAEGTTAVEQLWPRSSVGVESVDQLPPKLFGLLRSRLVQRH